MEMETWVFKAVVTIEVHAKCTKPFVPIAKKSAKSPLNPGKIARCIVGTVFPSTRTPVVKDEQGFLSVRKRE